MANFFDQFDDSAPAAAAKPDAPKVAAGGNFFDQFDEPPAANAREGRAANAFARGVVNGLPVVGPYALAGIDKADAAVRSLTGDTRYSDEAAKAQEYGDRVKAEHPWATTGGEVAGGVVGTAPLIMAAPAAFGAGAGGLAARTGMSLASGMAIGAADTAVRTDGDLAATRNGAIAGAAGGAAGPIVGNLAGRAVRSVSEMIGARANPVPGLNGQAAGKLADDLRNAGGPDAVRARLTELGPDAMLLDASPSFEGRAQGLAVLPDTREAITDALRTRAAGANARLTRDLDANVGPATNPATFARTLDTEYERVVPPLYGRAFAEPVQVNTTRVTSTIDRLAAQEKGGAATALGRARELLMTDGPAGADGLATRVVDTRPEALHNAKEALDGMIATVQAQAGGSARNSELRALTMTRRALNGALEEQVPGYGMANRTAQRFFEQREAFGRGQQLLNGGREAVRPGQLAEEIAAMALEVSMAQRDGLRSEIDRLVGTKANDRVALADAVKGEGDWNRVRLNTVFGEEPTAGVVGAVERERAFDAANQRITNNAMTELRKRAADDVALRTVGGGAGDFGTVVAGAVGGPQAVAGAAALRGIKAGADAVGREADIARNQQLAQAVTMIPGDALEAMLEALGARAASGARGEAAGDAVEMLVQALLQSQGERSRRILPDASRGQ